MGSWLGNGTWHSCPPIEWALKSLQQFKPLHLRLRNITEEGTERM